MTATAIPTRARSTSTGFDADFLRRVHVANLVLAVIFGGSIAFGIDAGWGLGFGCAALWSTANLWVLERLLRATLRPTDREWSKILVAAALKLPVLYGLLLLMVLKGGWPALSLVAGLSIPLVVVLLKALGRVLVLRNGRGLATQNAGRTDLQPRS